MLPVALSETGKISVPAERAGAVLTVYLPGSAPSVRTPRGWWPRWRSRTVAGSR